MGGEQMVIEYSILVRQIALDYNAYLYWQALLGSTELTGSLFDPQPGQVTGNIHSVTNPKEPVFGSVSVSTATDEKDFYFKISDSLLALPESPMHADAGGPK
jgi:hypothetical protein